MPIALQFLKEMGTTKRMILGSATVLVILLVALMMYNVSSNEMSVLYSDLELQDSNKIVQELESKGISFEIINNGTGIRVPQKDVLRLRMSMAQEGIPGRGSIIGYEIFDKEESLGSTSFLQNVKMLRALEGEITRTIESLDQVDKARLHLVMPRKELFSKEKQEPRASLAIKLKGGRTLNKQEVDSISHLIASSVPELNIENITVIDSKGRSLKLGNRDDEAGSFSGAQNDERKAAYESKFKRVIEELLEQTLGAGRVKAQVNLEMNFDRIVSNSEVYDPDGAVLRSAQTSEEKERTSSGGESTTDVSVANNLPGGSSGSSESESGAATVISKVDDTKNYEISKTITNQIRDSGAIQKIHVAVMIDGTYILDEQTGKETYQPRTQDELEKIENIVKVAVGYNAARQDQVKVINMPFAKEVEGFEEETIKDLLKEELPAVLQTLVAAILILGVFITVVKPIALKAFEIKKLESEEDELDKSEKAGANATAIASEEDPMLKILKTNSDNNVAVSKINDIATHSTPEVVGLLKRWLIEEG